MTNNNFALFTLRMRRIVKDSGQRIGKHRNCLFKRNTVLCLICLGLLKVPPWSAIVSG
jgi:hypothetical protein